MNQAPPGRPAAEFAARNQHGELLRLSDLRGTPVVLVFFPFAFTGICTGEMGQLRDQLSQLRAHRARLLAISTDTVYSLRAFADAEKLDFDLLSDFWPHGEIARQYGVFDPERGCALRGTFIIDADGMISWSLVNAIGEGRDLAEQLTRLGQPVC